MQTPGNNIDPKEKARLNGQAAEEDSVEADEGLVLYNDDGSPMDTSERTYVSVDLPDEETTEETTDA